MSDQPGTEIEYRANVDSWVAMLGPVGDLAAKIARTPFVPRAMQGNPAAVAAAILTGRELDLGPMTSLRGIDVIEGRPSLSAQLLAARILAAGHSIEWRESTDNRASVRITRADGRSEATSVFSMADARRAGLDTKGAWIKYPRAMLRARALTEAASMACPDVALGLDTDSPDSPQSVPSGRAVVSMQLDRSEPVAAPVGASEAVTDPEAPVGEGEPTYRRPEPEPGAVDTAEAPVNDRINEDEDEPRVSRMQLAKMHATIGDIENASGQTLDRDGRRELIISLAGEGNESLESSTELSRDIASQVIDKLNAMLAAIMAANEGPNNDGN